MPSGLLVYVDEAGIYRYIYRPHAWSRNGKCIYEKISGRKYRRIGIAAVLCQGKIVEPMEYDGTVDGRMFETRCEKLLCTAFKRGKVFIMDNAAFHRKKRLEHIAVTFGHRIIFLPPYSPELNPIEHFWAVLKKRLRKVMSHVRFIDDDIVLWLYVKKV